jgi:autotransporter-associated beta strand protein
VTYVYESHDDGVAFNNSSSAWGELGVRGDVRLGGRSYTAGSSTLASNYYPNYGEMMINVNQVGYLHNAANDYRGFRNTLMHEAMHGLGIRHVESSSSGFLIEPILSNAFDGPQLDDLLAIQRQYGDAYEKNGGNDVYTNAMLLGEVSPIEPASIGTLASSTVIPGNAVGFLSIDDNSDTDFFSFSLSSRLDVSLELAPQGATYQIGPEGGTQSEYNSLALSDLSLALVGSNGTSILQTANENGAGAGETIVRQLLPGTYYARVKGLDDFTQLYQLGITASTPAANNLVWVGNLDQNWDAGATENFSNSGAASVFYDFDHVMFDDSSSTKSVYLPGNVSAGNVQISTDEVYVFSGPGGIVGGNLIVDGSGTVELANAGNSYAGSTQVLAGTLAITGDANAMQSAITIAAGATLRMDATDAAAMTSSFAIDPGGILQIGTLTSTTNVFPDAPTAIVNEGTIRVLTSESLSAISGSGRIDVENGTTVLAANPSFNGQLTVMSGAVAQAADGAALGAAETTVVVENGGQLQLAEGGMFAQSFQLDDGATLELAGTNDFQESAQITGAGLITGALSMPGAIDPGSAEAPTGSLTIAESLTLLETSLLQFRLGGSNEAVDFATLHVMGSSILAGTLAVDLVNDFVPAADDTFELIAAEGDLSGIFAAVDLPDLDPSLTWDILYEEHAVVLQVTAAITILPGDFNLDGTVDAGDYTVWRDGLDTKYTQEDYAIWKSHFGESSGNGSGATLSQPAPEPATLLQTLFGLAAVLGYSLRPLRVGRTSCT